jgi:hypothetical protein
MKKKLMIVIAIFALLFIGGFFYISYVNSRELSLKENSNNALSQAGNYQQVMITKENLPDFFKAQGFVQDLPDNGVILVKFYNFDSGERAWEESYVIKKGSVEKGSVDNPDITIILSSKYIPYLGDFCRAVQKAKENGDIGYESSLGNVALTWKYKGMVKYKSCFGI